MISISNNTNNYRETRVVPLSSVTTMLSPQPQPQQQQQQQTMKDSILQINNDGVSLLRSGRNKAAMFRLARCLAMMKTNGVEGDIEVYYHFIRRSSRSRPAMHTNNYTTTMSSSSSSSSSWNPNPRYVFVAPIEVVVSSNESSSDDDAAAEQQPCCKLLSIVLFNLSLAHHLHALDLNNETIQYKVEDEIQRNREVCSLLDRTLQLYELCHSSLVFTNSGLLCSDLSIAVVVKNNVGEIHKELHNHQQERRRRQLLRPKKPHEEYSRTALACSEQLVQIFMFFTFNGESERLEDLVDILSNAMATLNGPQVLAPAA